MATLCLGAVSIGVISSFLLSLVPFFGALLISTAIAMATGVLRGQGFSTSFRSALGLLVFAQLGFAVGLLAKALATRGRKN